VAADVPADAVDCGVAGPDGVSVPGEEASDTGAAAGGAAILATAWIGEPLRSARRAVREVMLPGDAPLLSKVIVAIIPAPLTGVRRMMTMRTVPGTFGLIAVIAPAMSGPATIRGLARAAVS
jgi:hypothetical protein